LGEVVFGSRIAELGKVFAFGSGDVEWMIGWVRMELIVLLLVEISGEYTSVCGVHKGKSTIKSLARDALCKRRCCPVITSGFSPCWSGT
jgi:hypothetical protein